MKTILFITLVVSSIIDIKTHNVYIYSNLIIFILGLIEFKNTAYPILGLLIIPLTLIAINHIYHEEKIGYGDIDMIACAGFLLGYQKICVAFFIATIINILYALLNTKKGYSFIPFLSIGIFISFFIIN